MALTAQIQRYAVVASFALVSAWGLVSACRFGAASMDFYLVRNILSSWQVEGEQQTPLQYRQAKTALLSATEGHPHHPLYQDLLAQVYEWGAIADYEDREQALRAAKAHYLHAAQLRPLWPVTWASLAMVKWRQQEFDQEMLTYLQRADTLGPKKPEVHILFSELGLALYRTNHPMLLKIRAKFYQRLALGLQNPQSRDKVLAILQRYQANKQACRWLRDRSASLLKLIPECVAQEN